MCIRFGKDADPQCMVMDECLFGVQEKVQNFAVIYLGASMPMSFKVEELIDSRCGQGARL